MKKPKGKSYFQEIIIIKTTICESLYEIVSSEIRIGNFNNKVLILS